MKYSIKLPHAVDAVSRSRICMAISNVLADITADAAHKMVTEDLAIPARDLVSTEIDYLIEKLQGAGVEASLVQIDLDGKEAQYLTPAPGDYVDFGDVSRNRFGKQSQYGVRYLQEDSYLSKGIRVRGRYGRALDLTDYHSVEIHKDDVDTLVERVLTHRVAIGNMDLEAADEYRVCGMKGKRFFTNVGVVDGEAALSAATSLMSDRERADSKEDGKDIIRKLCQLRPGEQLTLHNAGTFTRHPTGKHMNYQFSFCGTVPLSRACGLLAEVVTPTQFSLALVADVFIKCRNRKKISYEDFDGLEGFTLVHYVALLDKLSNAGWVGEAVSPFHFSTLKTAIVRTAHGVQIIIVNPDTGKAVAHNVKVDQQGSTYCILTSVINPDGHDKGLVNVRELVDNIGEGL